MAMTGQDEEDGKQATRSLRTKAGQPFEARTGADQPWEPEDLAVAHGWDPTPKNVKRARLELEKDGPAAIEKTVP
jgi:hypothetical protein